MHVEHTRVAADPRPSPGAVTASPTPSHPAVRTPRVAGGTLGQGMWTLEAIAAVTGDGGRAGSGGGAPAAWVRTQGPGRPLAHTVG